MDPDPASAINARSESETPGEKLIDKFEICIKNCGRFRRNFFKES